MPSASTTQAPGWAWIVFACTIVPMLAVDLWVFRGERAESRKATGIWSLIWIATGLAFGVFVWRVMSASAAHEYYGAYAIEKGLSLDNLFLFYVIFQSLNVPKPSQHKVLFWGLLGAIVFRGLFIFLGVAAIERWAWVSWLFGAVLLYAAWTAFRTDPAEQRESRIVTWLSERLPVDEQSDTHDFMTERDGRRFATPLLLALIAIELSDIVFAVDSVPAALSITHDRFIVYSSNIFAILGLRSLYLYMASVLTHLRYLHYGLSAVLAFAGVKIVTDEWVHVHPLVSVGVVVVLVGGSVWASLRAV